MPKEKRKTKSQTDLVTQKPMTENEIFGAFLAGFRKNPVLFFEKILGVTTLEDYQRRAIETIAANERTAIAACHDLGKSYLMARIVIWFATCFPYSKVITTAPTFNQVKNILWSEIRAAHARAKFPLGGELNLTEWKLSEDGDWFAIGFTPKNEVIDEAGQGKQSSFQGFHAPYVLVVFDEATGIPHNIWTMAEGLLTSANVKFAAIGNPTTRNSEFFSCFRSPAWAKVKLSCFDSPNLKANGVNTLEDLERELLLLKSMPDDEAQTRMDAYKTPVGYLITLKWVMASIMKWGINHPLTVSKILGQFPEQSDNTLFPLGALEKAQLRIYYPKNTDRKVIGVDVARFGADSTVMHFMHGLRVEQRRTFQKRDTVEIAGEVIALCRDVEHVDVIVVDGTGLGGGVVDNLRQAQREKLLPRHTEIREVQFGAGVGCSGPKSCEHKDCDIARYANLKARIFCLLSDDIKREDGLCLPPNESVYLEELPAILYTYDSKGRYVIESKDAFKKRTGRGSPDTADSLALTNFGRYDEITVGSFGENFTQFNNTPFASGIGAKRQW